ncbi:tRNA-dependent cyclodipeptide synthase [Kitasatospora xanthocidica]|uniref:Cyclodipeptide synthase n=1 Tax=Kitasatospora xanthocidica TaxID=83382 RepID=A0A372ZN97_9ACTN|nr:tRNA-dependent cyclodipeptide synthase [Kitasatospora xanthocidica]
MRRVLAAEPVIAVPAEAVTVHPLNEQSREILDTGEAAVFGLSPFNGFYRPATVETLLAWAAGRFRHVEAVLPGYETAFGLIACGRAPREAAQSATRAVRRMRAAARRALHASGPNPHDRVNSWTRLINRKRYRELRAQIEDAFRSDGRLRELCREASRGYLMTVLGGEPTPAQIELNLGYVLAELPLVLDLPGITGTRTALLLYNRPWPLQLALWNGEVPALAPAPGHGFATIALAVEPAVAPAVEQAAPPNAGTRGAQS